MLTFQGPGLLLLLPFCLAALFPAKMPEDQSDSQQGEQQPEPEQGPPKLGFGKGWETLWRGGDQGVGGWGRFGRWREIPSAEYFAELLAIDLNGDLAHTAEGTFADVAQKDRFLQLWAQRWHEVATALNTRVEALDDDAAYHPEVMDVRGAIAALPEAERAEVGDEALPSFGQVW